MRFDDNYRRGRNAGLLLAIAATKEVQRAYYDTRNFEGAAAVGKLLAVLQETKDQLSPLGDKAAED